MTTKKIVLLTSLSVTAFSGLAQEDTEKLVVTATRFPQPVSTVLAPMDIVTRDEIDLWQAKSMTDVLRRLPGVDIAQSGGRGQAATLYVRGTEARHVLVLVDGIRLPVSGIMGIADFNQIPISLVQKVEFIRGPRSAVYGSEAIGGVINIITQSETDGAKIDAGLGSNHYQLYDGRVRQTIADKTTITAAGSFEDTRGFNVSPDSPYGPDRDRDGFRSKSFWAGVDHKFSSQFSAFVRGYGYSNNAEYDANSTYPNSANERQLYSRNYDMGLRFLEGNYSSQLVASYQTYKDYNFNSENGRYNDGTSLDDMTQRNIQWGNSYKLGSAVINGGIDWRQEKLESSDSYAADSYQRDNTGVYLTGQESLGDFIFEGAFRTDKNQVFGWHETWQSAVAWEFIPAYRVTLSYGTGFLAPTLGQLHGASRFGIVSNDNLKPEESRQWEAGLEGDTGPLNWRLAGYRNKITNLIGYESDPVTYDGQYINIESATIKGVEWTGSFETGVLNHRITLEYLDPRRDKDNEVLARRSKHKAKYQIDWNMFGLDMDVSYQYNGKRYDNNTSAYASEQKRLSSYSTVDVSAGYPVTEHLTVRGRVANLFDKDYQTAYKYQTAGREYYLTASYTF
ncbi:TonB-dependent vitamin B12 receptor BtuB [Budvicia aquatica]|uniref:Vitamin B12 transporter BtuB n=1 Tax=Budvicia aquatica TaxID=82979 RepID=A0A2C6DIP3_9GAMM|nr:TonB-dependent vitamin B12 receptor BtuB [Budvicia aquatica]MBP9642948.1 TonB-dependent vitamin B12 receptor BtuB [Budvicia sp.]PHI28623.1 TonB-dependent vitamin B12 receptor BtuB [Budvicia aquatica]VFS46623.1 Outer membrane cobalamin translocator [Budvicia aquatica]